MKTLKPSPKKQLLAWQAKDNNFLHKIYVSLRISFFKEAAHTYTRKCAEIHAL